MTVSTISSFASGLSRTLTNQNSRVTSSLQSLSSGSRFTSASVDVSGLAVSTDLSNQVTTLRTTAQNLAQSTALTDVANGGIKQITEGLNRLQQLSVQASSGTLSDSDRAALNTEFQAVRQQIDSIAQNTQFGGQTLLDGSLQTQDAASPGTAGTDTTTSPVISGLTDQNLFGGQDINLSTAANAAAASDAVANAQQYVSSQLATIGTIGENLQFATASVNSAIQNQEAATSTLSEADFTQTATESTSAKVQADATAALLAQTNRLQPSALTLLVE